MSEAGFRIFNVAFGIGSELLYAACLTLFLRPFLTGRGRPWKLALLFYAGAYLTVVFQQGMAALQEEQATRCVEYQQTQAIRARIHEAEQFYTRIRQLKHEMRGHMTNIKGLAQGGEYAGLEDYIARMDESVSGFELTLQTGNPVTDVIVNDTRRRSLDLGISFQAEFHYPASGTYDAFDVGIILQNLLQNAVEACRKVSGGKRFIVLAKAENELSQKDNDAYRRQHTVFSS